MKKIYFFSLLLSILFLAIFFSGCIEVEEEKKVEEETTTTILITTTTTIEENITSTTTPTITTTTLLLPISTTSTTTTSKLNFSCSDYCKKEGYESGECRKTPAQCRIYGINEIYKPLGDKYCKKTGAGYDACCCVFSVITTTTTPILTENKTEKNITIYLNLTPIEEEKNKAIGFKKIKPIETTFKYSEDGSLSLKILNLAGNIKILNISSGNCSQGIGLGSLDRTQLLNGEDTIFRAKCDKKSKGEKFEIDLKFSYKELVSETLEIYGEDEGLISGVVE